MEPLSVDIASLVAQSSKSRRSALAHGRSPRCFAASAKMLTAGRVAVRVVPENRPWRADLLGEELNQGKRAARFRGAVQSPDISAG